MKDSALFEVMNSICNADRNPMISELVFPLNEGFVEELHQPQTNKNKTTKKWTLSAIGMNKYEELKNTLKVV